MGYYRLVGIVDGETAEPVHYVGFHPVTWMIGNHEMIEPIVAFVKSDESEKLLLKIREELAKDPVIWAAELINEIDAVLILRGQ